MSKKSKFGKIASSSSSAAAAATTKRTDESWKVCGISRKFPAYRNAMFVSTDSWLHNKRKDDEAEGLWRIHDMLYDFTDFVDHHPGGAFWLRETRGTDITEQFEAHHIAKAPEHMIKKFEIRKASKPRNITLTFHQNGFYKTLKGRVREKLKDLDYTPSKRTDLYHLVLLTATLTLSVLYPRTESALVALAAALSMCWLTISAHNYFHRRDNWQMYTFNFSLMNFSTWRVSHALSHHAYPNSLYDLEMALFEPFLCWIPSVHFASKLRRVISVIIQPIIYTVLFAVDFVSRAITSLVRKNVMHWHDAIAFTLPLLMWVASGGVPLAIILRQWVFILALCSFLFGLIGLTAAHHAPKIHHDGDANRRDLDWGIFQLDTIIDRKDIKGSSFLVLTHFGEHALHHLFPTLDHSVLPQLYPILYATLKEFKLELRECSHLEHIIGQSEQLMRTEPNQIPPGGG